MFGYFLAAAFVLKTVAPDYKQLWRELSRLEGRFAFVHARTKSCAESIAFFGGDEREKAIVGQRFDELMAHDWLRNWVNFKFRIVEDLFQARLPDLIQWVVRFGYRLHLLKVSRGGFMQRLRLTEIYHTFCNY